MLAAVVSGIAGVLSFVAALEAFPAVKRWFAEREFRSTLEYLEGRAADIGRPELLELLHRDVDGKTISIQPRQH